MKEYRFRYDHSVSDGAGGYGAVEVTTHDGHVSYVGRSFAPTVLVERFPEAGLTYAEANHMLSYLSMGVSLSRTVVKQVV